MTEYMTKKGNRVIKFAFLYSICDVLKNNGIRFLIFEDHAFDKESDRVKFTYDKRKCILVGVGTPDLENATILLRVRTEWEGEPNTEVDVTVALENLHINTVERIAYEVYDWLRKEDDEDWDVYRDNLVASWLDSKM